MKTVFWNVDTQYDFMRSDGALYVPAAETIEPALRRLTQLAQKKQIKVVNTADWHNEHTAEISNTPDFVTTFPAHCMEHTPGAAYISATAPTKPYIIDWKEEAFDEQQLMEHRNVVLYKDAFDVFAGTPHADHIVTLLRPERAIVYGVATNVCVNDAVNGLLTRGIEVYVPLDAIKELPGIPLPYEQWQEAGARLTSTSEIEQLLEETL